MENEYTEKKKKKKETRKTKQEEKGKKIHDLRGQKKFGKVKEE